MFRWHRKLWQGDGWLRRKVRLPSETMSNENISISFEFFLYLSENLGSIRCFIHILLVSFAVYYYYSLYAVIIIRCMLLSFPICY